MEHLKPTTLPSLPTIILSQNMNASNQDEVEFMKKIPYQECVGALLYLSQRTRPDINIAVNHVSRFAKNPGPEHWNAVIRIFSYLKQTKDYSLIIDGTSELLLKGYVDSDWASDKDTRYSTTGYTFYFGNTLISWNSRKQTTVALSSAEA